MAFPGTRPIVRIVPRESDLKSKKKRANFDPSNRRSRSLCSRSLDPTANYGRFFLHNFFMYLGRFVCEWGLWRGPTHSRCWWLSRTLTSVFRLGGSCPSPRSTEFSTEFFNGSVVGVSWSVSKVRVRSFCHTRSRECLSRSCFVSAPAQSRAFGRTRTSKVSFPPKFGNEKRVVLKLYGLIHIKGLVSFLSDLESRWRVNSYLGRFQSLQFGKMESGSEDSHGV